MEDILERAKRDLVSANRILAHEGVLDALGHVSIRHPLNPERFIMSRTRSPEIIEIDDLLELNLDGSLVDPNGPASYSERFIHAAVYEAHPQLVAVCHSHDPEILPFTISEDVKLQSVIHSGRFLGLGVDVWDIADEFGTDTNMLVSSQEMGRSLVRALGDNPAILMRGHGCVVVCNSLIPMVNNCVMMAKNAKVQLAAMSLGRIKPLHPGETLYAQRAAVATPAPGTTPFIHDRPWEYYQYRAGLLDDH